MTDQAIHLLQDQKMMRGVMTSQAIHLLQEVKVIEATAAQVILHHLQIEVVGAVTILLVDHQVEAVPLVDHQAVLLAEATVHQEAEDKFQ